MPAPPNSVFSIVAFVAFFLCLIRFPMQLHSWNVGTHLFLAWIGLDCIFLGINSIIWNHNTVNWAPVWCDISSRFNLGVSVAMPASILCINRSLYLMASPTSILPSQAEKRREFMIDLVIGIGLPVLEMVLVIFAQDGRFKIVEDYGCSSSIAHTWISIVIVAVPPILLELIAGVYGCLSIRAFYKRRSQLNECFSRHPNFNSNRYIRLMCFSALDLFIGTPFAAVYLYFSIMGLSPFPGLSQEYQHISEVTQVPAVVWRTTTIHEMTFELKRWISVWGVFVFFAIFGFTEESRNNYRAMLQPVVQGFKMITGIKSHTSSMADESITFKTASVTNELPVDTSNSFLVVP